MRQLKWLVGLCLLWHVIKIIKSRDGEMLSKESRFQLHKHPTVKRADGSHVIKNISKVCCDHADTHGCDDDKIAKATAHSSAGDNNTVKILNIFKNILQYFQNSKHESSLCKNAENRQQRHLRPVTQQQRRELSNRDKRFVEPRFSILQQLRLDAQKQKWQQQQLELQQQQQALRLQHMLQNIENEDLGKADKKKKKRRKRKRKKRKKPAKDKRKKRKKNKHKPTKKPTALLAHPAQILFASATQKPHPLQQHDHYTHHPTTTKLTTTTTKKPLLQHPLIPIKKIKYILRKSTIFKKKKKEYLNHLKHVIYPFIKFIAFFTIINPFTLAVFLFSLASPVVFGFLGFISLSFFIKPALNLLFGVRHTVNTIKRRKLQQLRRRQRWRDSRRPITIHKHYYQQRPIAPTPPPPPAPHRHHPPAPPFSPPPSQPHPHVLALKPKSIVHHAVAIAKPNLQHPPRPAHAQPVKLFNPLLPDVRQKLKKDKHFIPDIKGHNDSFEQF